MFPQVRSSARCAATHVAPHDPSYGLRAAWLGACAATDGAPCRSPDWAAHLVGQA